MRGFYTMPIDTIHDDSLNDDYEAYVKDKVDLAMYPFPNAIVTSRRLSSANAQVVVTTPIALFALNLVRVEGERSIIWRLPRTVPTAYAIGNTLQRLSSDARSFVYGSRLSGLAHSEARRLNNLNYEPVQFVFILYDNELTMRLNPNVEFTVRMSNHTIDLTHHNDLHSQERGFFTDWAKQDKTYLFMANVTGALLANGDYLGVASW